MKLCITPGSPYVRIACIVLLGKGLGGRLDVIEAKTRTADSPCFAINSSGRVPYLVQDDGIGMEESALICSFLDHLDGKSTFELPVGEQALAARRLYAFSRSLIDGLSVWGRTLTGCSPPHRYNGTQLSFH